MKIISFRRFRYWVINFIASNPSPAKSIVIRGWIFLTLMLLTVSGRAAREIVYGRGSETPHLKTALRSMLWLWNRSWVPVKHPLSTFFDIGWILSEETCHVLSNRGFLSSNPLKQKCDLAQYTLSAIRQGAHCNDTAKLGRADREIITLVSSVFNAAWQRAGTADDSEITPPAKPTKKLRDPGKRDGGFDNDSTKNALIEFDELCTQLGQEYFLVSGTFLGVIREGAFIGHDYDIDLGVFEDALLKSLVPALKRSKNFTISTVEYACLRQVQNGQARYCMMEKPVIIKIFHRTGVAIDVFIHFYDGDVAWHGSSTLRWDNKRFELTDYAFLGRSFKGARDFELYLTENYGADWRTPKSDYDPVLDTPNMSFVGSASALVFYAWMLARAVAEQQPLRVRRYIKKLESLGIIDVQEKGITVR